MLSGAPASTGTGSTIGAAPAWITVRWLKVDEVSKLYPEYGHPGMSVVKRRVGPSTSRRRPEPRAHSHTAARTLSTVQRTGTGRGSD